MTTIDAPPARMEMPPHEIDAVWGHVARDAWRNVAPEHVTVTRARETGDVAVNIHFAGVAAVLHPRCNAITSREDIACGEWMFTDPEKYRALREAQALLARVSRRQLE